MSLISHYKNITSYITQDNSEIRELMHPNTQKNKLQSLAEAIIQPGETTLLHKHIESEELYYILQGEGKMILGDGILHVNYGDTICIQPGVKHNIKNTGNKDLKILCCCAPAYSHDDTVIIETTK